LIIHTEKDKNKVNSHKLQIQGSAEKQNYGDKPCSVGSPV